MASFPPELEQALTHVKDFDETHYALLYDVEKTCVEHFGMLDPIRMKVSGNLVWHTRKPIKQGEYKQLHDLESAGLVILEPSSPGTVALTELGWQVAGELRRHKAFGGSTKTFLPRQKSFDEMRSIQGYVLTANRG